MIRLNIRARAVSVAGTLSLMALLAGTCASTVEASDGRIGGSIGSVPQGALFPAVMAVSPQGKIGAVALASSSGSFNLAVPSGTYVLASSANEGETSLSAFSAPERIKAGHTVKVKSKIKLRAKAAASHGLLPSGAIVTVPSFEFTNNLLSPPELSQLRNLLINDLFEPCTKAGIVFVDTSPEFVKFAKQEKALSAAGMLAVPYEYKPLKPQYEITGSGSVENKGAGDELGLEVILSSVAHRAVANGFVNQEATSPEFGFGDVIEMLAKASTEFAAKVCGA